MNKPTSLLTAPPLTHFLPPHPKVLELLLFANDMMSFSLLKVLRPGYWEDLQFNNTSKLASRGPWFLKEKVEIEKERRERILPLRYTESALPDVLSRSSEMVEKASVEEETGGWRSRHAEERSHVHHHLFVYIETPDHCTELFEGYPAVSVPVCVDDGDRKSVV